MISPAIEHRALRQEMRARRRGIDAAVRQAAAQKLAALLTELPCYRSAQHIAAYSAVEGEMDPKALMLQAHNDGKRIYLPQLPADHTRALRFIRWQPDIAMQLNRVGIPEPVDDRNSAIAPQQLDLVLTPLVAFDCHGQRLGTGGGYYDYTFAFLKSGSTRPLLLGLAYEFQCLERIETRPWDVPLNGVVTDQHVYFFNTNTARRP